MKSNTGVNMNRLTRKEMNQLMTIPEVREIIEAKFAELRLLFTDKLREPEADEPEIIFTGNPSNIIRFPLPRGTGENSDGNPAPHGLPGKNQRESLQHLIKIVDASSYRKQPENEQVKILMRYFRDHRAIRKAVLDEFFLRILPYSDIPVENG
jgi:hypothetical protein